MYFFNLLYCDGDESEKLSLLYDLVVGPCLSEQQSKKKSIMELKPSNEHIIKQLETLITVPTLLMANIIEQSNKLNPKIPEDKVILEELARVLILLTDSTNT